MTLKEINKELKVHYQRIKELKKMRRDLFLSKIENKPLNYSHTNDDEYTKYSLFAKMINSLYNIKDSNKDDEIKNIIMNLSGFFIHKDKKYFSKDEAIEFLNSVQKYLKHFKGEQLEEDAKISFICFVYPYIEQFGVESVKNPFKNAVKNGEVIDKHIKLSNYLRPDGSLKIWNDEYKSL